jgi:hypothetical protein
LRIIIDFPSYYYNIIRHIFKIYILWLYKDRHNQTKNIVLWNLVISIFY